MTEERSSFFDGSTEYLDTRFIYEQQYSVIQTPNIQYVVVN